MAPETFTLNTVVQIRLTELPTVPIGLGGERDTDLIKLLGTEGKQAQTAIIIQLYELPKSCVFMRFNGFSHTVQYLLMYLQD